jgi:methylmalonyl-CoA mutase
MARSCRLCHFARMTDEMPFATEFPPTSEAEWRRLVETALKGAAFDKRLVSRTYDGLRIEPLYPRAAGAKPVTGRVPGSAWALMQRVDHPDPGAANAQALQDLENGATGLVLVMTGSVSANGYGLDPSPDTLARVLKEVQLDAGITIDFDLTPATSTVLQHFAVLVKNRKLSPASIDIRAGVNPIGGFAASGASPQPWRTMSKKFANAVGELASQGFRGGFALADGRIIHDAAGSEAQELAFAIATAVEYLRALEQGGISIDAARGMIYFRLSADADEFLTIAKFRALRKLWARIEQTSGLNPIPANLTAETAWRMMTRRDPYVNMLRTTVAIAAAGLGGADGITALPYTAALGLSDGFARRIARNTQLILLEESNLAKVSDPAGGSGAIENLTDKLCSAAWTFFQEIESAGGAWAALERGLIQRKVAAVRFEREQAVAKRRDALTGTSDYPDLNEYPATALDVAPITPPKEADPAIATEALPRIRLAEPFERLRDASDRMLERTGSRPEVFLGNLGKASDFTARTTYARNFYAAGGIAADTNNGFRDQAEMIAAFKASGARLVCLCSSDKVYATDAAQAAKALTAAGAVVQLAGRPGENEAPWRQAGVKAFIYTGCDTLATLQATHDILGVR